ncbi:MAG: YceI family protein [Chitinophagales bacterium]|nr:YceI family protein [Chitinophagales bacterium]MCZ2394713.1 YceI family protein [Chitinophagales bacterium]
MKKTILAFAISGAIFASCTSNPEGEKAEVNEATEVVESQGTQLTVDTQASKLVWTGKKVSTAHHGEIKIKSGSLIVEADALKGGQFIIDMTTLENKDLSGEWKAKLEDHLHKKDFFHTEKHPEAKLEITNVEGSGIGTAKVSANLTIKDVTKNITFNADVTEISDATFKATADFNIVRADWGIVYPGMPDDLISAEINFKVSIVANK